MAKEHNNSDKVGYTTVELNVRVSMILNWAATGRDQCFTVFNMTPLPYMKW